MARQNGRRRVLARRLGDDLSKQTEPSDTTGSLDWSASFFTVHDGRRDARPIRCFLAIAAALAEAGAELRREFGVVPRVRGALHAGAVISGEVGRGAARASSWLRRARSTPTRASDVTMGS